MGFDLLKYYTFAQSAEQYTDFEGPSFNAFFGGSGLGRPSGNSHCFFSEGFRLSHTSRDLKKC